MTLSRVAPWALPLSFVVHLAACVDNQTPLENPGTSTPPKPATSAAAAPPPAATESPPPLATVLMTDPAQLQQLFAAAAAANPAATAPGGAAGDPIEDGIRTVAYKQCPGMQPDGPIAKG